MEYYALLIKVKVGDGLKLPETRVEMSSLLKLGVRV